MSNTVSNSKDSQLSELTTPSTVRKVDKTKINSLDDQVAQNSAIFTAAFHPFYIDDDLGGFGEAKIQVQSVLWSQFVEKIVLALPPMNGSLAEVILFMPKLGEILLGAKYAADIGWSLKLSAKSAESVVILQKARHRLTDKLEDSLGDSVKLQIDTESEENGLTDD